MVRSTFSVATKVCTDCLQEKPLSAFRRRHRDKDKRHNQCRDCFARYMRYLRAVKRGKLTRAFVAKAKATTNLGVLTALCERMAQRFGGVDALAAELVARVRSAPNTPSGIRVGLDFFKVLTNLMLAADQQKSEQIDVRELTDDELDFAYREEDRRHEELCEQQKSLLRLEAVEQLLQSEPEYAIAAAVRLGWTVIPPSEDENDEE